MHYKVWVRTAVQMLLLLQSNAIKPIQLDHVQFITNCLYKLLSQVAGHFNHFSPCSLTFVYSQLSKQSSIKLHLKIHSAGGSVWFTRQSSERKNAKIIGSNERLIQFWLFLYPMVFFPLTPLKDIVTKELCNNHKCQFLNHYIIATWCRRPLTFQTISYVGSTS